MPNLILIDQGIFLSADTGKLACLTEILHLQCLLRYDAGMYFVEKTYRLYQLSFRSFFKNFLRLFTGTCKTAKKTWTSSVVFKWRFKYYQFTDPSFSRSYFLPFFSFDEDIFLSQTRNDSGPKLYVLYVFALATRKQQETSLKNKSAKIFSLQVRI
jgi:hypothetical protein